MKKIKGQVVYMGPTIPHLIGYGTIFRDGIHEHLYDAIRQCPALGELFIRVIDVATVRKQLDFDIGHQVRGTQGTYVTFYRAVEEWRTQQVSKPKQIKIETHHA